MASVQGVFQLSFKSKKIETFEPQEWTVSNILVQWLVAYSICFEAVKERAAVAETGMNY